MMRSRGLLRLRSGKALFSIMAAGSVAVFGLSPSVAQNVAQPSSIPQLPVHLIVFNKPGPNFDRLAELDRMARQHRAIYVKWAGEGEIIASGSLEGQPVLGITVFRRGADEQAIRRLLEGDPLVTAGVLDVEFRKWSIQMGALPDPGRRTAVCADRAEAADRHHE